MQFETETSPAASSRAGPSRDINWEAMFDAPDQGFITSVKNAPSSGALDQILDVIIKSLFNREDDSQVRDGYLAMAKEATGAADLEKSKQASLMLLEHIKRQRLRFQDRATRKSDEAADAPAPAEAPEPDAGEAWTDLSPDVGLSLEEPDWGQTEEQAGEQAGEQETKTAAPGVDDLFMDFIRRSIRRRLDAIGIPRLDSYKTKQILPFILSPDFAGHFERILKTEFLPALAKSVPGFLQQVENKPETERREFLAAALENRQHRTAIIESWKTVWRDLTETRELPKKPAPAASGGLLDRLVDKVRDKPSRRRQMTPEQWKKKVKEIKKANAQAEKNWQAIARDDGNYLPPREQDKKLLMDLLAASVSGLEKQVTALRQIASQGGSVKAFDAYAKSRDLDLALLSAYYRYPEHFQKPPTEEASSENQGENQGEDQDENQGESGAEGFLKNALKGYTPASRKSVFPLVDRFIYSDE